MKTAEQIISQDKYKSLKNLTLICDAMDEFAEQWKYDYSKECKCESSIGQTWCCNQCGLPYKMKDGWVELSQENAFIKNERDFFQRQNVELSLRSIDLHKQLIECKDALKMVLEIDQERQNLPHSIFTTLELEQIKALVNDCDALQSEASANG